AKRKPVGLDGIGALHTKRRHCGGRPSKLRRRVVSPRISTSAAPSTTTLMVHLPRFRSPLPVMSARRWFGCGKREMLVTFPIVNILGRYTRFILSSSANMVSIGQSYFQRVEQHECLQGVAVLPEARLAGSWVRCRALEVNRSPWHYRQR